MKIVSLLFFNTSLLLVGLASLLVVIANNDPANSALTIFVGFYISVLVTFTALLTLIVYFIKCNVFKSKLSPGLYFPSLRQAFFIAAALTVLLLLKGLRILDLWIGSSIMVAIILLELFFETKRVRSKTKY